MVETQAKIESELAPADSDVQTELLVIGAGPFGLALGSLAKEYGIDHLLVGQPMHLWKNHMPRGMVLRSGCDWHLDPVDDATIERFLESRGEVPSDVEPLSLAFYLQYAEWFQKTKGLQVRPVSVTRLDHVDGRLQATFDDGTRCRAKSVVLALGFAPFAHIPDELAKIVPTELSSHSRDLVEPEHFSGKRIVIIGGRQSAFESAALLAESGAEVDLCHRHDTPEFTTSDWSWVDPLLERVANEPGWYRSLSESERQALNDRFWEEGRLKLEPWLGPRVTRPEVTIRPNTSIVKCVQRGDVLQLHLNDGETIEADHVLYATGYKVDLQRVPFLVAGNVLDRIECLDGSPRLDDTLQTTVPGLYMTSLAAAREFGLFFAFTSAVRASSRIIGRALFE